MREIDVRGSARISLGVRRYHAWPMLQEQRVDAHVGQMMRVYCCVWGPPAPGVAWRITWHDAGEGDAGDCQHGAKRRWPALKRALDAAEEAHLCLLTSRDVRLEAQLAASEHADLTPREELRVKACDLLEGYEHALVDVAMGNHLAVPVVDAYAKGLRQHVEAMEDDDVAALAEYQQRSPLMKRLVTICERARAASDYGPREVT